MPVTLPPDLAAFLSTQEFAMVTVGSSEGALLVAKLPNADIEDIRGIRKIEVSYRLHRTSYGPAISLILTIFLDAFTDEDGVEHVPSVILETFFNPSDDVQMADFDDLLTHEHLRLLVYGDALDHRLSKKVTQPYLDPDLNTMGVRARQMLMEIDPIDINFDRAKAQIIADFPLGE